MTGDFAWTPDPARAGASNLARFMARHGIDRCDVEGYRALCARADADIEWFAGALASFWDLRFATPWTRVLDLPEGPAWPKWFAGATGNIVSSCLDARIAAGLGGRTLLVWDGEDGERRRWTYADLADATGRLANALRRLGIGPGDFVGLYMPTVPEAVAAFLAVAKIGAAVLPMFSGFGPKALAARLADVDAKAVITADGTRRRGRDLGMKAVLDEALEAVPGVRHVVVARCLGGDVPMRAGRDHRWDDLLAAERPEAETVAVPADHVLMVVHTSGTTGRPKGTVHTHFGLLFRVAVDYGFMVDLQPDDVFLRIADMGWLGGPSLAVAAPLLGATCILPEGVPDHPRADRFWRMIEAHRATIVGVTPTLVRSMMRHGTAALEAVDRSSLRHAIAAGEPWDAESWTWTFRHLLGGRGPILNASGGTEIGGYIVGTSVLHPLKPCCFGGPVPGTAADVVDERGERAAPGEPGELVIRRPAIGLTQGLHGDPARYLETYWSRYPGMWTQSDEASIDADGLWYIHGRSDDTIKVSGKRTGPAEIEALLVATGKVAEAAVVGLPDPVKGATLCCACIAAPGTVADAAAEAALSEAVVAGAGASFRPKSVRFVDELPRTSTNKLARSVVRDLWLGRMPADVSALGNPGCLGPLAARLNGTAG